MSDERTSTKISRRRSPLRILGISLSTAFAVYISGIAAYQVLTRTILSEALPTELDCHSGTQALYDSLVLASNASPRKPLTEREAVAAFRAAVQPTWKYATSVRQKCESKGDLTALQALRSVELLRYAEERSVRISALDLSRWRERTPRLLKQLAAEN